MRRLEAYKVLEAVYFNKRHAHLVLKDQNFKIEDQAFISALVYTTLQHSLYLDYQFDDLVDKKLPKEVRLVLKMACAQYFKMEAIPDYALVNEYVELTKEINKKHYAGVVNAVLKKIINRKERPVNGDGLDKASVEYSMPLWILKLLAKQYSEQEAIEYAKYCQQIKPSYVRLNTLKSQSDLDMSVFDTHNGHLIAKPELFRSGYFEQGLALIQDINSQRVVNQLGLEAEMEVLDCCCGPGTKTSQIAAILNNTGHIDGVELYESRAKATVELMERVGATNTTIHTSDVLDFNLGKKYDRILVDAPCSGLGVLSHKHDLRYHILPDDLDALQTLQAQMLEHLSDQVKVGGYLMYSTCTLNRKENEKQIESFLKKHDNYECELSETLIPMETGGDGFYIAKLKRTW